jgi:hypothetical protein
MLMLTPDTKSATMEPCCRGRIASIVAGDVVMRIVFSDESGVGSKKNEPITVVTAIVLNMDRQWEPVSASLSAVRREVRKKNKNLLEKGRALKGKLLYSAIRKGLPEADRILREVLQVIVDQKILVFYGAVDRATFDDYRGILKFTERERGMTAFDKAFEACFSVVDRAVRTFTNEQILWIADRSDKERESATKTSLFYHRLNEMAMPAGYVAGQMGAPLETGESRIADTVYFGSSAESVALQLADICCSTVTLHLLEQNYDWSPVVGPYYEIIRDSILNNGAPVLYPPSAKSKK